jgi:hypothetical protein
MPKPAILSLPPELLDWILAFVPVVQLTAFATTSRCAQEACNNHLQRRLRWLDRAAGIGTNMYLQVYLRVFRQTVNLETRIAIRMALPFISCPDDFRDYHEQVQAFYIKVASAVTAARDGYRMSLYTLREAEDAAQKAGLPPPDSAAIQQIYFAAAAPKLESDARRDARNGYSSSLRLLSEAEDAAQRAGLPPPDSAAIRQLYFAAPAPRFPPRSAHDLEEEAPTVEEVD